MKGNEMARQKRQSIHYVNNADFSQAVVEYVTRVNEARENNKDIPLVTDYIAQCFLRNMEMTRAIKLSEHLLIHCVIELIK
jgi:hypothetical protein